MKKSICIKLLITFFIISSCEKECETNDQLTFIEGKYYCGKKLYTGWIFTYNGKQFASPSSPSYSQSYNKVKEFHNGNLVYQEGHGEDGWLDYKDYFYPDLDDLFPGHYKYLFYKNKYNNNYYSSSFEFVSPLFLTEPRSMPMDIDGNTYVNHFPDVLDRQTLTNITSPRGTIKSILGSLRRSSISFRDSIVQTKVKFYENMVGNLIFDHQQIEVFKEEDGEVTLGGDYSAFVSFGGIENINPKKFVTLEYNTIRRDEQTMKMDSINNTITSIYSDIICRNKLWHECLVIQGESRNSLNTRNVKHDNEVYRDFHKDIFQRFTIIRPEGAGENWSIN